MSPELRNKEEKRAFEPQKSARAKNFQKKQGDWLVDGKRHYGDGLYKVASELLEVEEITLRQQKWLSELFELYTRVYSLSFSHHREVASLKTVEIIPDKKLKQGRMQWSKEPDKVKMAELLKWAENGENDKPFIYNKNTAAAMLLQSL